MSVRFTLPEEAHVVYVCNDVVLDVRYQSSLALPSPLQKTPAWQRGLQPC